MANALFHDSPIYSTIRPAPENRDPSSIRVLSYYSFISQGTERTVANGNVPKASREFMRVPYMKGSFELPISYGYSLSGIVIQPGHKFDRFAVHIMHPHQDECFVKEDAIRIVPDAISAKRSILAPNMETAVNGIWNSGIENDQTAIILGFGSVGALLAIALSGMTNCKILVSETNENRKQIAEKLGFEIWDKREKADVVFHTTGTERGLQSALDSLVPYGKVVELSWYGDRPVCLHLGGSFHYHSNQIISSQVSTIPPHMQGWDFAKRSQLVWQLLLDDRCDEVIQKEITFEESPAFFEELRKGTVDYLGVAINYGNE